MRISIVAGVVILSLSACTRPEAEFSVVQSVRNSDGIQAMHTEFTMHEQTTTVTLDVRGICFVDVLSISGTDVDLTIRWLDDTNLHISYPRGRTTTLNRDGESVGCGSSVAATIHIDES